MDDLTSAYFFNPFSLSVCSLLDIVLTDGDTPSKIDKILLQKAYVPGDEHTP